MIRRYLFSTDHKVIGVQYAVAAAAFLLTGFSLVMLMRWQLAFPGKELPLISKWFGENAFPSGVMAPEFYNQLGAMHGTIMVFLGIVPMAVGAFGNYLLPLQIGASDMAFPKLNMASFWIFLLGGIIMLSSFFATGGAPQNGWTSYPPLSDIAPMGQTFWLVGMIALITSSLLGSINFIVTVFHLRAPGLTFYRLPIFVWAQLVTAFLLLLAFPPLESASFMQLMDRLAGSSFFLPSGLVVSGEPLNAAGGGNPLLWQHLFWFLAHPEVYVLILPAIGIVAEVITTNTRKPLYGYRTLVHSLLFLGLMSFLVWAHHMFITGMGTALSSFFQATTLIISIPSIVMLTTFLLTLWGASIRFNVPMLFALGFLPMFAIGGLTGLPLALAASDIHLHDTYYVIGHFHYLVAPGTLFALFAGVYHWFPKVTGRRMSDILGKIHFWGSLIFMNGIFLPMFLVGMAGVSRRLYDMSLYEHAKSVFPLNVVMSVSAWCLALAQLPFLFNLVWSFFKGSRSVENPWQSTTLEWVTTSPPPTHNFVGAVTVHRDPYDYTCDEKDYCPQNSPEEGR
jgi:cytochrome c oxidase subunit I